MQTADVHPSGSHAALLSYDMEFSPDDGGLPPSLAAAMAEGLTRCGLVAGRWFDDDRPAGEARFLPAAKRGLLQRVVHPAPANLVVTRSPTVVERMFDQGWWMRYQALLVLEGFGDDGADEALEALRRLRDWRAFAFASTTQALIAPGVDGDVALIAAGSEIDLVKVLESMTASLLSAGFVFGTA